MALDLAKATALILALGLLHDLNLRYLQPYPQVHRFACGLIFGIMSVLAMSIPIHFEGGIIFDSRSAVLGMAGLFGGLLAAAVAATVAIVYRIYIGGIGVTLGITIILLSIGMGLVYRLLVQRKILRINLMQLLAFGAVLHALTLMAFYWLPNSVRGEFFARLALPYFLITTVATALLGMVLRSLQMRENTKRALTESEARLRAITQASPDTSLVIDETGLIQEVFSPLPTLLDLPIDAVRNHTLQALYPPEQVVMFMEYLQQVLSEKTAPPRVYCFKSATGPQYFEARGRTIDTPMHNRRAALITLRNVTTTVRNEEDLRIAGIAFENQSGMVVTDVQGVILRVNRAFTQLTGYTAEEATGQHIRLLSSGHHDHSFYQAMWNGILKSGCWEGEVWNRHRDGSLYPAHLTISAVYNEQGEISHYVGALHDLTRDKQFEEELHSLAFFDQLTALPNRRLFNDHLRSSLGHNSYGALLFINLDDFKNINELFNHHTGDLLLQRVAQRLRVMVEPTYTASRFGADEFVVLLDNLGDSLSAVQQIARQFAEQVLERIRQPFTLDHQVRQVTASIGIVIFGRDKAEANDLVLRADLAMHEAKRRGKNRIFFFDPVMQEEVMARLKLEDDLRVAIQERQLELHYQPQVDALGRVAGLEALVRWNHPTRGRVSPAEFISVAETAGLMPTLGQELLTQACYQLQQWSSHPQLSSLSLSVNLSMAQIFADNFVESLLKLLQDTGVPPSRLVLELTESILLNDVQHAQNILKTLGDHGVRFSIDDFGTGYSSLSYLQRLPLNELKIDRSFVVDLPENTSNSAIVRTILALAHTLGLEVVAEGVETEDQWETLRSLGCHYFQGYLFARPMPDSALQKWVEQQELSPPRSVGKSSGLPQHVPSFTNAQDIPAIS